MMSNQWILTELMGLPPSEQMHILITLYETKSHKKEGCVYDCSYDKARNQVILCQLDSDGDYTRIVRVDDKSVLFIGNQDLYYGDDWLERELVNRLRKKKINRLLYIDSLTPF